MIKSNKMNKIKTYTHKGILTGMLGSAAMILLLMMGSCNKDFPNKLKGDSKNDTLGVNSKTRKVLYIIVDGVRGRALKQINAPNISGIIKNSIYAYDGIAGAEDINLSNGSTWTNMLTGVNPAKHGVVSDDFSTNKLSQYPTMITRLKASRPGLRTAAFSASAAFGANLTADATENKSFEGDDLAVKNAVKTELDRADASIVVAQFHGVEAAGLAGSYETSSIAYANAILKLDTYVGEIMNALSLRKSFSSENWLVVIASNKGGEIAPDPNSADITKFAEGLRNNFVIFYNPRFSSLFVPKPDSEKVPYTGSSIRFDYAADARPVAIASSQTMYNFGSFGSYTIEVLFKSNTGNQNYPIFLGKRTAGFTGAGWNFFLENDKWGLNTGSSDQLFGKSITDGKWHKLTVVFDGVAKKVRVYTDGTLDGETVLRSDNMNNDAPLRAGYIPGNGNTTASLLLNELKIFNVALTPTEIAAFSCKTDIKPNHPKYGNVIGYWPMREGLGNIVKERSGRGVDMLLGGTVPWETFAVVSPTLCPDIDEAFFKMVPNNVDIPVEIYHWMGVSVPVSWGLTGKSWDPIYSDIKN